MQGLHTSEPSSFASLISYIAMLKLTWMTWSSRLESTTSSSPTSRKPSTGCTSSGGSSTQPSASSAYCKGNYSVSSSVTEELKPTQRRLFPSQTWELHRRSRISRSSQGAWRLLTDSSHDLGKEDYLSSNFSSGKTSSNGQRRGHRSWKISGIIFSCSPSSRLHYMARIDYYALS
jgi:hypothetical protein